MLTDYPGRLLNHVEILYRRGERELAKAFFTLLGCTIVDTQTDSGTGSSILYVYPEASCQDRLNNVLYLSEIREPQWQLEQLLDARLTEDAELRDAVARYDDKARNHPHGISHFGLRYPSFESLEVVIDEPATPPANRDGRAGGRRPGPSRRHPLDDRRAHPSVCAHRHRLRAACSRSVS